MRLHIVAVGEGTGWEVGVQGHECRLMDGAQRVLVPIRTLIPRHHTLEEATTRILMTLIWLVIFFE